MKHLRITVLIAVLVMRCDAMSASSLEERTKHQINLKMIDVVESYRQNCSLSEDKQRTLFLSLFKDADRRIIYNDVIGTPSFQQFVSPLEYVESVNISASMLLNTEISKIRKNGTTLRKEGSLWYGKYYLEKYLMLIDASVFSGGTQGAVMFDSARYGKDFQLILEIAYDEDTKKCHIAKIDAQQLQPTSSLDDEKFSVVVSSGNKNEKVVRVGKDEHLLFDEYGQAFITYNQYRSSDDDISLFAEELASKSNYNVLSFKYKTNRFRAKLRYSFTPSYAYNIESPINFSDVKSKASEVGADIGIMFPLKGKWRLGVYTGAALSTSSIQMSSGGIEYQYKIYSRKDSRHTTSETEVIRNYNIQTVSESLSFMDIMVPLYLENEIGIGNRVAIFLDLGVKCYFNGKNSISPFHTSYSVDNTKQKDIDFTSFVNPVNYGRHSLDICYFADLGVDIRIYKKLYGCLSCGYELSTKPSYQSHMFEFYKKGSIYPIVYSPSDDKDLAMHSFIGCISYTRRGIWCSTGLKIKF